MTARPPADPTRSTGQGHDPIELVAGHLGAGDDVVRCAAARALGALADPRAAAALVEALLDPDPDVRTDAMAALVATARPDDAEAIRRSLEGDPVKDVKVAAIEALTRLGDRASVPLLRTLVGDRAADRVAWEDETDVWDDWLDVQLAAIGGLGAMGVVDAIPDLLAARADEMGQDVDAVVLAALAEIPGEGLTTLVGLLGEREPRARGRVVAALAKARHELLDRVRPLLIADPSPRVRGLAIAGLDPDDPAARGLALDDPDAGIRRMAVAAFAPQRPELAQAALRDPDEAVRAAALGALVETGDGDPEGDLAANVEAWMATAGPALAGAAASALAALEGKAAAGPLGRLAADVERPLPVRVAALGALGTLDGAPVIEALSAALVDRAQPVRTAALVALAAIAGRPGDTAAGAQLVAAIAGRLEAAVAAPPDERDADGSAAASRVEELGARHLRISRDGEIIREERPPAPAEGAPDDPYPQSTLDAIQAGASASPGPNGALEPAAEDEGPIEPPAAPTRRVPVDGPADVASDVRIVAMRVAAGLPSAAVEAALVEAAGAPAAEIAVAAGEALAARAALAPLGAAALAMLGEALGAEDARLRAAAARAILATAPDAGDRLGELVADPDATVRSIAVHAVAAEAPGRAVTHLGDPAPVVRKAALDAISTHGDAACVEAAVTTCLDAAHAGGLAALARGSALARNRLLTLLAEPDLPRQRRVIALDALAGAASAASAAG